MDIARIQPFAQKMEDQRQRRRTQEFEEGPSKRERAMGQSMVSPEESISRMLPPRPSFSYSTTGAPSHSRGFRGIHIGQGGRMPDS